MQVAEDIEIVALVGKGTRLEYANYALIVNHKSKTYVRVDVMNKNVISLLQVFNISPSDSSLQRFNDIKGFKSKYPKYK